MGIDYVDVIYHECVWHPVLQVLGERVCVDL